MSFVGRSTLHVHRRAPDPRRRPLTIARSAVVATVCVTFVAALVYWGYEASENPANQLFGKTIVRGPSDQRVVALTYDDGPNPPYTNRILDVLSHEGVRATFFLVGRAVAAYPAVVAREARQGNALGNH